MNVEPNEVNPYEVANKRLAEASIGPDEVKARLRTTLDENRALQKALTDARRALQESERAAASVGNEQRAGGDSEFGANADDARTSWTDRLIATATYLTQEERAGRRAPQRESSRSVLAALVDGRGRLTQAQVAAVLPASAHARTTLVAIRGVLNREGYDVLTIEDDGTVVLDQDLANQQFGVET